MASHTHNPEKRAWRGCSHRKGGQSVADLRAEAELRAVEASRDYSDAAAIAFQKAEFASHGVNADGTCACESKTARPVRVAGRLVCARPECARVIG